ncbi:hypothetical protein EYC84_007709 [Monilinia fructicola]|uniref:Uncharacterized protein n=1 Tax=Monilinia fructicola TaxID=38448 RepID=A0A5M9JL56_MONFR|nr:hypothetical protein EYC84_007709 [Monilinia fructicola]
MWRYVSSILASTLWMMPFKTQTTNLCIRQTSTRYASLSPSPFLPRWERISIKLSSLQRITWAHTVAIVKVEAFFASSPWKFLFFVEIGFAVYSAYKVAQELWSYCTVSNVHAKGLSIILST